MKGFTDIQAAITRQKKRDEERKIAHMKANPLAQFASVTGKHPTLSTRGTPCVELPKKVEQESPKAPAESATASADAELPKGQELEPKKVAEGKGKGNKKGGVK